MGRRTGGGRNNPNTGVAEAGRRPPAELAPVLRAGRATRPRQMSHACTCAALLRSKLPRAAADGMCQMVMAGATACNMHHPHTPHDRDTTWSAHNIVCGRWGARVMPISWRLSPHTGRPRAAACSRWRRSGPVCRANRMRPSYVCGREHAHTRMHCKARIHSCEGPTRGHVILARVVPRCSGNDNCWKIGVNMNLWRRCRPLMNQGVGSMGITKRKCRDKRRALVVGD